MLESKSMPQPLRLSERLVRTELGQESSEAPAYLEVRLPLHQLPGYLGSVSVEPGSHRLCCQVAHDQPQPPVDALLVPFEVCVGILDLLDALSVELPLETVESESLHFLLQ